MSRPVFIINFKNYPEVLGEGSLRLAASAVRVASRLDVELIVAPPVPALALLTAKLEIQVFSQRVDDAEEGKSTGSVVPEALKGWMCSGSLVNHSESRVPLETVGRVVSRMKKIGLATCVCAENPDEVSAVSGFEPEMIAIEPRDLIGTGMAVSRARPELVEDSVTAAREAGFRGTVLCGAGIVSGDDAASAVRLGAQGILVSSAVVRADDWESKISELSGALLSGRS